ncbi:hypothetical protein RB595_009664 [Gaeumannomyces hyphopodioides]
MSPSSDASRPLPQPRSGILTPASDGSVNRLSPRGLGARRKVSADSSAVATDSTKRPTRTRPALPMEELLKASIVVKPHPPNVLAKPVTLQPLMLLPRECLPLAHIDLADPHGELPPVRFFESRIRIMELEGRLGSNTLIARSESSRIVYAIERHDNGYYVLCKLGSWVDMAELVEDSTVACSERITLAKAPSASSGCFEPPLITPHIYSESKRKRQAIEDLQSLCKKRQRSQSVTSLVPQHPPQHQSQVPQCHLITPVDDVSQADQPVAGSPTEQQSRTFPFQDEAQLPTSVQQTSSTMPDTQQTAGDIFNHIRAQYLETLYHSMGSLAYFAKGPLSRARAAFNLNCDGNLDMEDLIGFLKSLVLTTILIDKKYLTTIPGVVEQMKLSVESSDEGRVNRPKKRLPKKTRIGKDGLYPNEGDDVKRWWTRTRPELRDEETSVNPQQVRYHISCLRRRETLLQLILILEILSLEGSQQIGGAVDIQLPGLEASSQGPAKSTDANKKKRNKHNFPVLLDVHADRLCIWESTTLDEVKALAESQSRTGEVRKSEKPLVDFCVDVILPFFSSRLPEPCDLLNRKLGGPVLKSPPKQRREKAAESSSKPRAKPGAPSKRPGAKSVSSGKSARSLERVLSNDKLRRSVSRGPSDALAHLRHATVSHVPGLKREVSETRILKDIPSAETNSLKDHPTNPLLSRSASFTTVEDARAKKKALVEAELQDAISALKKPNRVLAGKVLAEESERRLFAGPTYVTKPKKPVPSPAGNKVQVKATPANIRFKNALADDPHHGRGFNLSRAHQALKPASMASRTAGADLAGLTRDPCVANTPLATRTWQISDTILRDVGTMDSHERGDDFVLTSSPIQARKRAARPQPPQWPKPTPSRGLLFPPGQSDMIPASSPQRPLEEDEDPLSTSVRGNGKAMSRAHSLAETPVKPRPRPIAAPTVAVSSLVVETPRAKKAMAAALSSIPVGVSPPKAAQTKTIYQQLGWDDDYPDELS